MIRGISLRASMKLRFASMPMGLAVGVTAATLIACATGAYFYSVHHFNSLLDSARSTALSKGELIRAALEHQMVENDRSLIGRMIESFGQQPLVEKVMLLDRHGIERYSSKPQERGNELDIDSPTCQACHRLPPAQRGSSRIIETRGGTVLRTVIPVRNREACYRCHDPSHRINGILILDYNVGEVRSAMTSDLRWMVLGTGALTLLLVGCIGLVIRIFLLRRLQRFETAAREIAAGDLARRVPAEGTDTISWLAREFNTMADSMTRLLGEVETQRERLEKVINSIDDGIVVLDASRMIIAANDAFIRRSGHSRNEILGCCCQNLSHNACEVTDCPSLACLKTGEPQIRICERRNPEGAMTCEEVHASPVLDSSGELQQVVEVWRDISERRTAEARLADSHRLASLGLLASGFSHELNTPLATVLTCIEGILRETSTANNSPEWNHVAENAAVARDQLLRCRGITQHFLRMSRGQKSAGDVVDVERAILAVSRLIEPTARAHSVHIDIGSAGSGLHVRADEAELQHALINLMLNAIQACQPNGRISISAIGGEQIRIKVSDNGCGIKAEDSKRIFEPFFSLRKGGTGLGLFLALNFVRSWNGDMLVESVPGKGSTFEVVFPAPGAATETGVSS